MKYALLLLCGSVATLCGCAMFTAWKSIPPPGGCDQCHTVAISANWQVTYKPVNLADERGRLPFQTPEFNQPDLGGQQSRLEEKKLDEMACFDCHNAPTQTHRGRKGRFHH